MTSNYIDFALASIAVDLPHRLPALLGPGRPYPAMPLADVAWILEQTDRFCDTHGLGFGAYPMHELAAHPQAVELLRLFADHVGAAELEPLSTTGVPLALRQDWQDVLAAATSLGTTTVWVAFHGLGVEHDRQVNRPGAYAETCLAIQRVHAAGLRQPARRRCPGRAQPGAGARWAVHRRGLVRTRPAAGR